MNKKDIYFITTPSNKKQLTLPLKNLTNLTWWWLHVFSTNMASKKDHTFDIVFLVVSIIFVVVEVL